MSKLDDEDAFVIRIPQGFCGTLLRENKFSHFMRSMYTGHFSTCNLVVLVGKERVTLIHVDTIMIGYQTSALHAIFHEELHRADIDRCYIIYSASRGGGSLRLQLEEFIWDHFEGLKPCILSTEFQGIQVSFIEREADLAPQIFPCSMPDISKLVCHPREQRFDAIRSILTIFPLASRWNHLPIRICESGFWSNLNTRISASVRRPILKPQIEILSRPA
jgi:hypothetical protein